MSVSHILSTNTTLNRNINSEVKDITIDELFIYKNSPSVGYVLTSDSDGIGTWQVSSSTGPQGPIGPTGAIGLQGPTGQTGATGPSGISTISGLFTPTLLIGGDDTGVVYVNQFGNYTKIGDVVNYTINLAISDKGSNTGVVKIGGFPFTASGFINYSSPVFYFDLTLGGANTVFLQSDGNEAFLNYSTSFNQSSLNAFTEATIGNDTSIQVNSFYFSS